MITDLEPRKPRHSADGHPHYAYFDADTQLSFVWDGRSEAIEVCHGGYGEPVIDLHQVSSVVPTTQMGASAWLQYFQAACRVYIIKKESE